MDNEIRKIFASITPKEARMIVKHLNDDPSITAEDFRWIVEELFPPEIQGVLKQERIIQ